MKISTSSKSARRLVALLSASAIITATVLFDSCDRHHHECRHDHAQPQPTTQTTTQTKATVQQTLSSVMTVANISTSDDGSAEVIFNENTEFFRVADATVLNALKDAFSTGKPLNVSFDPWQGQVVKVSEPSAQSIANMPVRGVSDASGTAMKIDLATAKDETLDNASAMGIMNMTEPSLTGVIPDFATAQMMFDYISHQCCKIPGPYAIDFCIPFQYCIDGCYARAHKMCYIINKRYHYATKKIFSFANAGTDKLCVQGQKWGGCCINWWYHVAPLVTVNTPTGPKAYVFDPAMFDQPVLMSVWLHAQENPSCVPSGKTPHVTMINIRPTASYAPSGSSGYSFSTDPMYSATDTTLVHYRNLHTCP